LQIREKVGRLAAVAEFPKTQTKEHHDKRVRQQRDEVMPGVMPKLSLHVKQVIALASAESEKFSVGDEHFMD
jgi:hypothetical protein